MRRAEHLARELVEQVRGEEACSTARDRRRMWVCLRALAPWPVFAGWRKSPSGLSPGGNRQYQHRRHHAPGFAPGTHADGTLVAGQNQGVTSNHPGQLPNS